MKFSETRLPGAFVVEPEFHADARGFFARTFCTKEFSARGLESRLVQCSVSWSRGQGTLRGLHFQWAPWGEVKLVRCTRGEILDVIVDLRSDSPAFGQHVAVNLSAENHCALYVPKGFAHGFQTLVDDVEVFYQMSDPYVAESSGGINAMDPALGIQWPLPLTQMSEKDRALPSLSEIKDRLFREATR